MIRAPLSGRGDLLKDNLCDLMDSMEHLLKME